MSSKCFIRMVSRWALVIFLAAVGGNAEAADDSVRQPSVAELTAQLSAGDAAGRVSAAEALAECGEAARTAVPALIRALDDEDGTAEWLRSGAVPVAARTALSQRHDSTARSRPPTGGRRTRPTASRRC